MVHGNLGLRSGVIGVQNSHVTRRESQRDSDTTINVQCPVSDATAVNPFYDSNTMDFCVILAADIQRLVAAATTINYVKPCAITAR